MVLDAASALDLSGPATQGGLIVGRAEPGARVVLDGRTIRVAPDGRFLIGFGRDHGPRARLTVTAPDGRASHHALAVAQRRYALQRIDGLPPKLVTPDPETLRRIEDERAQIRAARALESPELLFGLAFAWPAAGPVSGVFGSQRVLNGEPRAPHLGLDIAAPEGAPVRAAAAGRVALAHEDMVLTGKTLLLDHGHGLTTSYIHLSEILVRAGETVAQGTPIGSVGKTGRTTAAHLHWGAHLFDVALDPQLLVSGPAEAARAETKN
ncbi:MAG: M23 family metallopeptidase [Rhodospirillales bacterium]|nr:M23 family metallopeptidase [Rhodospirillales bacterium]